MRAVLFEDVGSLAVGDYPVPEVLEPDDAVVRVTTSAICGSDLHLLHGRIPGVRPGSVVGHEFVGVIESAGDAVTGVKAGDRVVGSFPIACGACWFCARGDYNYCADGRVLGYGLFTGDLDGAQAEYVRIPVASLNLLEVPAALTDEQAIFAGDVLSTGAYIAERAAIRPGDVVAVTGAGPVGLFAIMNALTYEPEVVYAVDKEPSRLELAERLGAVPVDASKVNPVVDVQRRTGERGADVVIECVGAIPALTSALDMVRHGGTLAVIGVYSELEYPFPIGEVWRRGLRIEMGGQTNVHGVWRDALDRVEKGLLDPTVIITHRLALDEALKGYELFERREALKVILTP